MLSETKFKLRQSWTLLFRTLAGWHIQQVYSDPWRYPCDSVPFRAAFIPEAQKSGRGQHLESVARLWTSRKSNLPRLRPAHNRNGDYVKVSRKPLSTDRKWGCRSSAGGGTTGVNTTATLHAFVHTRVRATHAGSKSASRTLRRRWIHGRIRRVQSRRSSRTIRYANVGDAWARASVSENWPNVKMKRQQFFKHNFLKIKLI